MSDHIQKNDLYVYDLADDVLSSLEVIYFNSELEEVQIKRTEEPKPVVKPITKSKRVYSCTSCRIEKFSDGNGDYRSHFKSDFHKFNLKRVIKGLDPVDELQFSKLISENRDSKTEKAGTNDEEHSDSSSDSGSDSDSESEERNDDGNDAQDELDTIIEAEVQNLNIRDDDSDAGVVSHLNTQSPLVFLRSSKLPEGKVFGVYKCLFSKNGLQHPLKSISTWKEQDQSQKFSVLFMIGGGHFAGAIVSHQRVASSGNSGKKSKLSVQEQSVQFLEQKTFHRYTTRRKQGGSQSANDNAKGKANSAGSTLRRYNEAALKSDVQSLLKDWEPYISKAENIFIRAKSVSDRKIFLDNTCISKDDSRLKSFPFTTMRPTSHELKRAWCDLTYLTINDKPQPKVKKVIPATQPMKSTPKRSTPEPSSQPSEEEQHSEKLISMIQKSKAPLLISYIRKNGIDINFRLQPSSEYHHNPTMLHFASANGYKHMVLVLLSTLKADPTITNENGKTAWDLAKDNSIRESFQLARHNLGEDYTNWAESHIGEPLSTEEIEARRQKLMLEEESQKKLLIEKELQAVKERIKEEKEAKRGPGRQLDSSAPNAQINLNSLSENQRLRLMREQRARAAEARMKKFSGN